MGAVYEATDVSLRRAVAIKVMQGRAFGDPVALRRFEREARACARLEHPNVVSAFDYGLAGAEGAFLVMELVRGRTLRAELDAVGSIPPALTAVWFDQILSAIAAAHAQGIVHRDLKPENVLVTAGPLGHEIRIVDFGLALVRTLEDTTGRLTDPGVVMGTMHYMAPEQLRAGVVDTRADVFALGVMVFEAVTGRRPFDGNTPVELLLSMMAGPVPLERSGTNRAPP